MCPRYGGLVPLQHVNSSPIPHQAPGIGGTTNRCIIFFCRCTYLNTHIHGDISLSLHGFLPTGFVWSQGRQGRYIRTNSTGIQRRRPGVPRETKMAPQGRPIKRRHGAQDLPMKAKRQKRIHDLSAAIAKGRH